MIPYETVQKVVDIFVQNISKEYKNANLRLTPNKEEFYSISYH
jgi:sulfite reductase (NADPH) flavoprotein alpha-component